MSIDFEQIKPHRGDQRWAFEELCFLLFADHSRASGEAVRREGAGGDEGLEGYIHDGAGRVKNGMQSKFFTGRDFRSGWWSQMNESVQRALAENAPHGAMEEYVICTPRTFTKKQRARWEDLCLDWMGYALTLGYSTAPTIAHWGYSELEALLLQPAHRGQLLYWFSFPDFDRQRCVHLNVTTIAGLHERFMPGLHTPTECEAELHRFLRTERYWQEFLNRTREGVGRVHDGDWMRREDWPEPVAHLVADAKSKFSALLQFFGDGCHLPPIVRELVVAGKAFEISAGRLHDAVTDYLEGERKAAAARSAPKSKELEKKTKDLLHEFHLSVNGWDT